MTEKKADIIIHKVNDVYVWVECENSIAFELDEYFTFFAPNYRFMPKYKNKVWDGKIHLFSVRTRQIFLGLVPYIQKFSQRFGYSCSIDKDVLNKKKIEPRIVKQFLKELHIHSSGKKLPPYDFQMFALWCAMTHKRTIILSPTSSGKSLIIYALCRWFQIILPKNKKILILAPRTGLVKQMESDMKDYSSEVSWNTKNEVHTIMGGRKKTSDAQIYISTWQSIYRMKESYFEQFGAIIVDEVHEAEASSICKIMENLVDCPNRIGLTGTLRDSRTSKLTLEGLFGPAKRMTTTNELMERKIVAKLKIQGLCLVYTDEEKKALRKAKYKQEIDWLVDNTRRTDFIAKLAVVQKKNGLILFNFIKHGKSICNRIKQLDPSRKVYFVDGSVSADKREEIRHLVERGKNVIVVASYGTFSTGISIKNIHWIQFASPTKSKIRTLQSIGRGLRINKEKNSVILYDIADDLSWKRHENYSLKHFSSRIDFYNREKFEFKMKRIRI